MGSPPTDKKLSGVFVHFSCAASLKMREYGSVSIPQKRSSPRCA
jgi:hypothetical protein